MKTNKLPMSDWSDSQAAGSQSELEDQLTDRYLVRNKTKIASYMSGASNDAHYKGKSVNAASLGADAIKSSNLTKNRSTLSNTSVSKKSDVKLQYASTIYNKNLSKKGAHSMADIQISDAIPERVFMNSLIKHTGIALAIIVPLAAFSAYAAVPQSVPVKVGTSKVIAADIDIKPSSIIHKSATEPTTVDSLNLAKYSGTWYEIGRLPMYFQRKCVSDVTATYTPKVEGEGITVLNQCTGEDGKPIKAEGLAKPADNTGSKLKVTFLPSWIRWMPIGRADYWVLAHDPNYKTALVGTPDKEYLWLLARSPNISQEAYAKYRQIAQQQGYNLKAFKLTDHSNQTVNLVP